MWLQPLWPLQWNGKPWVSFGCLLFLTAAVLPCYLASEGKAEYNSAIRGCTSNFIPCALLLRHFFPGKWKVRRERIHSVSHWAGSCGPSQMRGFREKLLLWEIWNVTVVWVGSSLDDSGPSSARSVRALKHSLESEARTFYTSSVRRLLTIELAKSFFGAMGTRLFRPLPPAPSYCNFLKVSVFSPRRACKKWVNAYVATSHLFILAVCFRSSSERLWCINKLWPVIPEGGNGRPCMENLF